MRILMMFVVLVFASTALASPTTQPAYVAAHATALQLLADRRYPEAREAFTQLTKDDPKDAAAFCGLGTTLLYLGIDKEAAYALERAKLLNPTDRDTVHNLVVARCRVGDFEKACSVLTAYSRGHAIDEPLLDLWITASLRGDSWGNDVQSALAAIESARPGMRKWGINWVTEAEFKKLESTNVPKIRQRRELRKEFHETEDELGRARKKLENARNAVRRGASSDEERDALRAAVSKWENKCEELFRDCERLADQIGRLTAVIIEPGMLLRFDPVVPGENQ